MENSRIELRGIVLPVQMGGLLGGPKGMLAPPLKLLGGPGPPSSCAYVSFVFVKSCDCFSLSVHSAEPCMVLELICSRCV